MQQRAILTAMMLSFFGTSAFGGNEVGSGGEVVACNDGPHLQLWLLDYWEAAQPWEDLEIDLGPAGIPAAQKVEAVLQRVARVDQARAAAYGQLTQHFQKVLQQSSTPLPEILDDGYVVVLPTNCVKKQLARQKREADGSLSLTVDGSLWSELDENDKAGLFLHEAAYREALDRGLTDSLHARPFNAFLSSKQLEAASPEQYHAKELSLGYAEHRYTDPPNTWMLRLFDAERLSFADANDYCKSLSGEGRIWDAGSPDWHALAASPFGAFIAQQPAFTAWIWASDQAVNAMTWGEEPSFVHEDPTQLASVVCWNDP